MNEALQHPWLRADAAAPALLLSSVVVERLRSFTRTTRLERLLLNVAANQLSNKDIDRLADMFRALDFDGDGCAQVQMRRKRSLTHSRDGCSMCSSCVKVCHQRCLCTAGASGICCCSGS